MLLAKYGCQRTADETKRLYVSFFTKPRGICGITSRGEIEFQQLEYCVEQGHPFTPAHGGGTSLLWSRVFIGVAERFMQPMASIKAAVLAPLS